MIDLEDTYRRLAHPWSPDELAARYREAEQRGAEELSPGHHEITRPLTLLATAIPPAATMSVAIDMLHALPAATGGTVALQLLGTAETNAAAALHDCHRALELDGAARGYTANEWLPIVCDIAAPQIESARLNEEPPTIVQQTQEAIGWLSHAVVELDQDSSEAPAALAETMARLLTALVFAATARDRRDR